MQHSLLPITFVSALMFCLAGSALAEVDVAGKIVDENGSAVAFAKVEARLSPSSPAAAATSDISGGFSLRLPSPGIRLIHSQVAGFFAFYLRQGMRDGFNQ